MKRHPLTTLALGVLLSAPLAPQARGQASAPASAEHAAGGMLVFDGQRLALAVRDYVSNQLPQLLTTEIASHKAFAHYRRVTQFVGVDVFRSGAVRDALTSRPPAHHPTRYEEVYRREYAPGSPKRSRTAWHGCVWTS